MLIIDLSQIAIANLMVQTQAWKKVGRVDLNIDKLRHMILEAILNVVRQFRREYGDVIIACDIGKSWRKAAFPYYKGLRQDVKDQYLIDWSAYYTFLNEIIEEIKDFFPYIVININHAEGDDVIGTLVRHYQLTQMMEQILIVSGDKDFKQLHNERTRQYSPILRKYIGCQDPVEDLKCHIIKGDRLDGVPNILSNDDCLVVKDRQTKITAKRLKYHLETDPSEYDATTQRNWARNRLMIDLSQTPKRLQDEILAAFVNQHANPVRNDVFNYLIKYRLKDLQPSAAEF